MTRGPVIHQVAPTPRRHHGVNTESGFSSSGAEAGWRRGLRHQTSVTTDTGTPSSSTKRTWSRDPMTRGPVTSQTTPVPRFYHETTSTNSEFFTLPGSPSKEGLRHGSMLEDRRKIQSKPRVLPTSLEDTDPNILRYHSYI